MPGLLPSFMIIGERKCGTTSLYRYLTAHPSVLPCRVKETHFFSRSSRSVRRNFEHYRSYFPSSDATVVHTQHMDLDGNDEIIEFTTAQRIEPGRRYITGEASANVLMTVPPQRLFEHLPKLKLIAVVRDPVARAFSHHAMHVRFRREGRWQYRFVRDYARDFIRERRLTRLGIRGPYLAPGRYADNIERWLHVYPQEQLSIVRTEDLEHPDSRQSVLRGLEAYLGIPSLGDFTADVHKRNVASSVPRDDETAAWLRDYFAPHNARLETLAGRSFDWC